MDKIVKNLQLILMCIVLVSTVIAVGIEIKNMFLNQSVTLADLLSGPKSKFLNLEYSDRLFSTK